MNSIPPIKLDDPDHEKEKNEGMKPDLPMAPVQATYLAWIDARALHDPHELFLRHGVALSPGEQFGAPGFVRLNFGTQRDRLREALRRMRSALKPAG